MTQNYFKGKVTVVFPATPTSPLYGKILPVWGDKADKSDQINFNMFALRENKKFPEEGGACEIDYRDSSRWVKKENNGKEFYTPIIPFVVYFKIKQTEQRDGSMKLVAVSIYSPDKLSLEERTRADQITKKPSDKELSGEAISLIEKIEADFEESRKVSKKHVSKKKKHVIEVEIDFDEMDDEEAVAYLREQEYEQEAANYRPYNSYTPVDNQTEDEEPEDDEEVDDERDFEEEEKEYGSFYEVEEVHKKDFDDSDDR